MSDENRITIKVDMPVDEPKDGRLFTPAAVEQIVEQAREMAGGRRLIGMTAPVQEMDRVDLSKATHLVTGVAREGGALELEEAQG